MKPERMSGTRMSDNGESLETILSLLKQMESTLLGLKQLRGYVGGVGQQMLEVLIEDAEQKLLEVKRRIIQ